MIKVATVLLLSLFVSACAIDSTNNVVLKQAYSSGKSKVATLFLKEVGATSDNSLQVSVAPANQKLGKEEVGNAFTADSGHNEATQDSSSVNMLWLSGDTLLIEYDKKLRVFTQNHKVGNTIIIYRER